jgi:DNA-binding helix-hairpin-helix protein with protein kinase domain
MARSGSGEQHASNSRKVNFLPEKKSVANSEIFFCSDSFSVGLLCFYLLSRGHHPFGDGFGKGIDIARDQKIGAGNDFVQFSFVFFFYLFSFSSY